MRLGENSNNKEWQNLAKKLHEEGYASADLRFPWPRRQHHRATWHAQQQTASWWSKAFGGTNKRTSKAWKGFAFNEAPVLPKSSTSNSSTPITPCLTGNDGAAAKAYLDDADCNSSNLTLIGAKDGGTIGAIWLNAEFHRFRYVPAGKTSFKDDLESPKTPKAKT